jgi:hypothetical protein
MTALFERNEHLAKFSSDIDTTKLGLSHEATLEISQLRSGWSAAKKMFQVLKGRRKIAGQSTVSSG